ALLTPFLGHFRAFYPHPAHGSGRGRDHPLSGTKETWLTSFDALSRHRCSPATRHHAAVRRDQRGQVVRRPSRDYCMQPTAKTERGPIATSGPSLLVCHRTRRFLQTKSIRFSPLAAAQ